ncbi:MAG: ATP-binding cassette domain-containing protein [Acidimicrobiia bacterium]|nr:ATP-binding cassette domain-containing protein [Acidimicrobiia bacterium]NNF63634.1 ATP-binding cassette domain-containing protein [Acidimicrobiia bacterium]
MSSPAIVVESISKRFDDVEALNAVSLVAETGQVLGLLGPNGAGKTTLVRILTTLIVPDTGSASVLGLDVVDDARALRGRIGLAGQFAAVDELLTGRENLELVGRLYHLTKAEASKRAAEVLERFDLVDAGDRQVKTYSGGMRRRLDLGASLVGRPRVLLLDEPTTGLDPRSRLELWSLIEELVADGTTLLLTTQYLEEADRLADQIVVIDHGQVIAEGTSSELKDELGADVLEVHVVDFSRSAQAAAVLDTLNDAEVSVDADTGRLRLPVPRGAQALVDAVRRLDDAGVAIADLALRRPTLDDVFLTLTGHPAESEDATNLSGETV